MGLTLSLERGHEGHIREVPQADRCSSMYSNHMQLCIVVVLQIVRSHIMLLFLHQGY